MSSDSSDVDVRPRRGALKPTKKGKVATKPRASSVPPPKKGKVATKNSKAGTTKKAVVTSKKLPKLKPQPKPQPKPKKKVESDSDSDSGSESDYELARGNRTKQKNRPKPKRTIQRRLSQRRSRDYSDSDSDAPYSSASESSDSDYRSEPESDYDDRDPPNQFRLPTSDPARIWTLTGLPASGKSYMMRYLMYLYAQLGFFRTGLVIAPTAAFSGDYDWVRNPAALWDKYDENRLMAYMESLKAKRKALQEKTGDPKAMLPPNFIIIDDCIGMINSGSWFTNFVSTARHTSTHLFFLNQYIAAARNVSTTLRNNTNFALMWRQPMEQSVDALYKAYGGFFESKKEFKEALLNNNGRKYSCLVYRSGYDDKESSYLRLCAGEIPKDFKIMF